MFNKVRRGREKTRPPEKKFSAVPEDSRQEIICRGEVQIFREIDFCEIGKRYKVYGVL